MLWNFWSILCESALFILVGFAIAGLLDVVLSSKRVIGLVSAARPRSVFLATLIGVPLPLCSCSVLPTAVTLRKKGASRGATLSFLISTPETSVPSILLTYALLGPLLAIFRPIAACVTALAAGLIENAVQRRFPGPEPPQPDEPGVAEDAPDSADPSCHCGSPDEGRGLARLRGAMRYAFVDLFDDIFGWILIGIVAAAAIQAWLPADLLSRILGGPLQSMLLMVLIGIPLYVCAEGSTPIAAALVAGGMNPGAAVVFLLAGPATNIGSLGVLRSLLGRRTVIIYLATIIVVALLMGAVANDLLGGTVGGLTTRVLAEPLVPAWLKVPGAIVFLLLGAASLRRSRHLARLANWLDARLPLPVSATAVRLLAGIVLLGAYLGSGCFIVRPGEVGIVRRFGAIRQADAPPGWHYALPYPVDMVDRVAVSRVRRTVIGLQYDQRGSLTQLSNPRESWNLVGDENVADVKTAVHWGVRRDQVVRFRYRVAEPHTLVRDATLAATREVFSGASINTVFTLNRRECEQEIERRIQAQLDSYESGIRVRSFHVLDAHAPPEVHAAFRDVASALEDRATQIDQARTTEAQLIPLARGEAAQKAAAAQAYATRTVLLAHGQAERFCSLLEVYRDWPAVTGRRLEFEALEQVLPKLRKYIKPPTADAGELEIWLVESGLAEQVAKWPPGR